MRKAGEKDVVVEVGVVGGEAHPKRWSVVSVTAAIHPSPVTGSALV